ncbi:MAG: aldo/keto reductase [Kiritimatiellaeota bacterium]|nr:aldo/keto reductase [Kiritimatiellota bacterium]
MKLRSLGKTGLQVSEIGVGAWQLGGPLLLDGKADGHPDLGREFSINLIRQCGDLGINFVDTAEQYGAGESERRVGAALKGQRSRWILSTKFGAQVGPNGERMTDASAKRLSISLEGSLRRLQTDYLDVYLWHVPPKPGEAEEAAKFLLEAKRKGQVRVIGISTANAESAAFVQRLGCLDVVQFPHSMVSPPDPLVALLATSGAGGIVRGAFAGGRLSGKYFHQAPQFPPDDIRSTRLGNSAALAQDFARYAAFEELLTPARGMIPLALRWLLDEPTTSTIIPGGKSLADYQHAIRATELPPLTAAEHVHIEQLKRKLLAT